MTRSVSIQATRGATEPTTGLVVFRYDGQRYALPLTSVERIVRAVSITPLPQAPAAVLGVVDVEGRVVAVFDARRRFSLPPRPIAPSDHLLIARTSRRTVALIVDTAEGVSERPDRDIVHAGPALADLGPIQGVARLDDGLVLIHDLEQFLSAEEADVLDAAPRRNAALNAG